MKKRLISAIIVLAIVIPLIYFGGIPFQLAILTLSLFGFLEFVNLDKKIPEFVKIISMLCLATIVFMNFGQNDERFLISSGIMSIIILIHFCICIFYHKNKDFNIIKCFKLLGVIFFLGLTFSLFIVIRNAGVLPFVYLISIAIFTDTFAHIFGTRFGKNKVTEISPNKSWEGYIGGTIFGTFLSSILAYLIFTDPSYNVIFIILITFLLSIIGSIGDLFFSQIKRHYGVKDFSNIMPGHGGILDRLDSIMLIMLAATFISILF